ncbi:MAG: hypothetical protein AAFU64_07900, partial [Bacteroidota bacterium]
MLKLSQTYLRGFLICFALLGTTLINHSWAFEGSSFSLYDAEKDTVITSYIDFGSQFNLVELPSQLTLVDDPFPFYDQPIESVVFFVNGEEVRTENRAPYALGGDINGDLFAYPFTPGNVEIEVLYYSKDNGEGDLLGVTGIQFCLYELESRPVFQTDIPEKTVGGTTAKFLELTLSAGEKTEIDFYL